MIRYFIIGFPHTATTYCYKYILKKFRHLKGVFEPFNAEVVGWCKSYKKVHHYSEGEVEHHYDLLSPELRSLIELNARWLWDWVNNDKPVQPYLGLFWSRILNSLQYSRDQYLVKDVCAWVRLREIVPLLPTTQFILLQKDRGSVLRDFLMLYDRVNKNIRSPRWGLGLSLFYRYFYGVDKYPKDFNKKSMVGIFRDLYAKYLNLCGEVSKFWNVRIISFEGRLEDWMIERVI